MDKSERVQNYFKDLDPGEFRATRHVEEDLDTGYHQLSKVLNKLAVGPESFLVTDSGPYTGKGVPQRALYKRYARRG